MPSAHEIREWARGQGYQVENRGNVPKDIRTAYDAAHPGPNGSAGTPHPDYPDDDFESAFVEPPDDEAFDESVMAESAPRRPKASTSRSRGNSSAKTRFWQRGSGKQAGGKSAKKRPRTSTEDVIGSAWRVLARFAPYPPLQRVMRIQSLVVGSVLEDTVKDTALDLFLQPVARIAGQGRVISAVLGPPVIVTALSFHVQQRASMQPPQDPSPLFVSMGIEALRSSLLTWAEITEGKILVAQKQAAEIEARYGQSVDDLIALILAPAVNPADAAAVQAEEDAIRRAQGIVVDA